MIAKGIINSIVLMTVHTSVLMNEQPSVVMTVHVITSITVTSVLITVTSVLITVTSVLIR